MEWSLFGRLRGHAQKQGGRTALIEQNTGRSVTYAKLFEAVDGSAGPGPLAVVNVGNRIDFVVRFLGTLHHQQTALLADVTVPSTELVRLKSLASEQDLSGGGVLLASSGTTELPKLVKRNREGLTSVARSMVRAIGHRPDDRVLAAVPLAHSYGMEHGLLAPLWAGCTVLLCDGLDLPAIAAAWRAGTTIFPAVPSMLELLLRSGLPVIDTLRRVYTAGAPLPTAVAEAFERRYGVAVGQVYGATEFGSVTYRDPARDAPGTVGRAVHGVHLTIDPDGELLVRSHGRADYHGTGDLARLSADGELTLLGRSNLLIEVGGAKVNPLEVESVLGRHPGVAESVVLPLTLSETVHKVRAVVVPADPAAPPSSTELRQFVRHHLARHKVPRLIEFRDSLPRTPVGKIARQLLEMS